jgi:hypothetical protein
VPQILDKFLASRRDPFRSPLTVDLHHARPGGPTSIDRIVVARELRRPVAELDHRGLAEEQESRGQRVVHLRPRRSARHPEVLLFWTLADRWNVTYGSRRVVANPPADRKCGKAW